MNRLLLFFTFVLPLFFISPAHADHHTCYPATASGIQSNDTVLVNFHDRSLVQLYGKNLPVKMAGIVMPDESLVCSGENLSSSASSLLAQLVPANTPVNVCVPYSGRNELAADIDINGVSVSHHFIQTGLAKYPENTTAWCYNRRRQLGVALEQDRFINWSTKEEAEKAVVKLETMNPNQLKALLSWLACSLSPPLKCG